MSPTLVGTPDPNEPATGATVLPFVPRPTDATAPGAELVPTGEIVDAELVPADENTAIDARLARRAALAVRAIGTH